MTLQGTVLVTGNKPVTNQPESGVRAHVPESFTVSDSSSITNMNGSLRPVGQFFQTGTSNPLVVPAIHSGLSAP